MKAKLLFSIIFFISSLFLIFSLTQNLEKKEIKYFALGDSYTIGTGTTLQNSWPHLLTNKLNEVGIKTSLVGNPARNGYSTDDLINYELPILAKTDIDFVTLLIGVNDWVRNVDKKTFQTNYEKIIVEVQKKLGASKNKIILVTIPDFGLTPQGKQYANGRDISSGLEEFNSIIKQSAQKYSLSLVDIFPCSKKVSSDPSLIAADSLHPSAKQYAQWANLIFPMAKKINSQN